MIVQKGVTQEDQCIYEWYIRKMSDILNTGKVILCLGVIYSDSGLDSLVFSHPSSQKDGFMRK